VARTAARIHLVASLGGHLELLAALGRYLDGYERVWVTAAETGADRIRSTGDVVLDVPRFNRSRPLTALKNTASSLALALRERPRVVVTTGAGSVVAFCVFARLLGAKVVFIETMARVTSPSASGRVFSRIASRVLVQWPEMERVYPGAIVCRPALWEDVRERGGPRRGGTFVSVGTHRHPFDRLLELVDRAVEEGVLPEPVVAQSGTCSYSPSHFSAQPMLTQDEVLDALEQAEYVVCHAGSGIISAALRSGHKPLVLPRRGSLSEHVDDHQEQIVRKLSELDLIVPLDGRVTEADLAAAREGVRPPSDVADGLAMPEVLARELEDLVHEGRAGAVHGARSA
jgi:UDP-N-acetylglucosamine--N-acetylmuramyl-(pentapeptide) pyrophosphoryl-undecaprenol N-acetylglucosamine transferase